MYHWNNIKSEIICITEGKRNSLTLPTWPNPMGTRLGAQRILGLWFLPGREVNVCERWPSFPSCVGCRQRDLALSHPIRNTEVNGMTAGRKEAGRTAAGALGGHQRNVDPTHCVTNAIRKPANDPLGTPHLQTLPTGLQSHPMLCTLTCTCPTLWPAPWAHPLWQQVQAFADSQGALVESQSNSVGLCESTPTWAFGTVLGKANRRVSAPSLALQNGEKALSVNNSPSRERTRIVEQEYQQERSEKASQSLTRMMEGISLSKSVKTRGGDCFFKCEDRSQNFKKNKTIKETWHN